MHVIGCAGTLAVALVLLYTVFPYEVGLVFPRGGRPAGLRGEGIDYLFIGLLPVVVWLVPPLVRALAQLTHGAHRLILGRTGFYVRFPTPRRVRFRDTLVLSLAPFAIGLVVISEIEYFLSGADLGTFTRSLFAIPFLSLAGLVTSLLPGAWLVDALDLRLVNPAKGEVVREAALLEGIMGPVGALALLVSFVTLAHSVGDSYEQGIVLLGIWAVRMFPPVLAAVSVYRIIIEPGVLPGLRTWADREGIHVVPDMGSSLAALVPSGRSRVETAADAAARPRAGPASDSRAAAESPEAVSYKGSEQGDEQEGGRDD